MYSKLAIKTFIMTLVIALILFLMSLVIYDPLQVYHRTSSNMNVCGDNPRETMQAFIKYLDFDSVIVGASLSANSSSSEASQKLGAKYFNMSIIGSTTFERKIVLDFLFRHKKIKNMIYFLDSPYITKYKDSSKFPLSAWGFLYDDNPLNDLKIYFNDRYMNCLFKHSKAANCIGKSRNLDALYTWKNQTEHNRRFGGFNNWAKYYKDDGQIQYAFGMLEKSRLKIPQTRISQRELNKCTKNINDNLIYYVEKYPDLNFYIVIPPMSTLYWSYLLRNNGDFLAKRYAVLKFLAQESLKYKNLKVYSFDGISEFGDIKIYKDMLHFDTEINSYVIDSIKENKNILTVKNVDENYQKAIAQAKKFDYEYYVNIAKKTIKESKK